MVGWLVGKLVVWMVG